MGDYRRMQDAGDEPRLRAPRVVGATPEAQQAAFTGGSLNSGPSVGRSPERSPAGGGFDRAAKRGTVSRASFRQPPMGFDAATTRSSSSSKPWATDVVVTEGGDVPYDPEDPVATVEYEARKLAACVESLRGQLQVASVDSGRVAPGQCAEIRSTNARAGQAVQKVRNAFVALGRRGRGGSGRRSSEEGRVLRKLKSDFDQIFRLYSDILPQVEQVMASAQQVLKSDIRRMSLGKEQMTRAMAGGGGGADDEGWNPYAVQAQQQSLEQRPPHQRQLSQMGFHALDQDLLQREEDLRDAQQVATEASQIKEVMMDLSELVNEQGDNLVQIDQQVEEADEEVKEATKKIDEANKQWRKANRKKAMFMCCCLLIIVVVVVVIIHPWK